MTNLWLSLEYWIKRNVKEINFSSHPTSSPDRSDKYVKKLIFRKQNWEQSNDIKLNYYFENNEQLKLCDYKTHKRKIRQAKLENIEILNKSTTYTHRETHT